MILLMQVLSMVAWASDNKGPSFQEIDIDWRWESAHFHLNWESAEKVRNLIEVGKTGEKPRVGSITAENQVWLEKEVRAVLQGADKAPGTAKHCEMAQLRIRAKISDKKSLERLFCSEDKDAESKRAVEMVSTLASVY